MIFKAPSNQTILRLYYNENTVVQLSETTLTAFLIHCNTLQHESYKYTCNSKLWQYSSNNCCLETSFSCSCHSNFYFTSFLLHSSPSTWIQICCTKPTSGHSYAYYAVYYTNYIIFHLQKLTLVLPDSFVPKDPCMFWNKDLHRHHNAIHMQNVI